MAYIRIYLAVRRHKNQIQALQIQQVAQAGEVAIFSSLAKSAVGIFYVYLFFLVCYLPYFLVLVAIKMKGPNVVFKRLFLTSGTLVYFNSSLNPVIYCWKMRHIRHAVTNILRNMSWFSDRNHSKPLHRSAILRHDSVSSLQSAKALNVCKTADSINLGYFKHRKSNIN